MKELNHLLTYSKRERYRLPVLSGKHVLIIAPHPDDETLGCGGIIPLLQESGWKIIILLLTDGNNKSAKESQTEKRINEFKNAEKILLADRVEYLMIPDGEVYDNREELQIIIGKVIDRCHPEMIFIPYVMDYNRDHRAVSLILSNAMTIDAAILMYEIWTPILYPDCYIDITKYYSSKIKAMECYSSQDKLYQIEQRCIKLNEYRAALSLRKNVTYIEAFKSFNRAQFNGMIHRLEENNWFS